MTEKENLTLVCIQFYLNIVGNNENNNPDNTKLDEANKLDKDKIYNEQIFFWNNVKKYFFYENRYKTILCPSFFNNNSKLF